MTGGHIHRLSSYWVDGCLRLIIGRFYCRGIIDGGAGFRLGVSICEQSVLGVGIIGWSRPVLEGRCVCEACGFALGYVLDSSGLVFRAWREHSYCSVIVLSD